MYIGPPTPTIADRESRQHLVGPQVALRVFLSIPELTRLNTFETVKIVGKHHQNSVVHGVVKSVSLAMMLADLDKTSGTSEVDETFLGVVRPGKRGRGALGNVMVIIARRAQGPHGLQSHQDARDI